MAVLRFLVKFKDVYSRNHSSKVSAICCFPSYIEVHSELLLLIQPTRSSMPVDSRQSEMLRTHGIVMLVLL